MGMWIDRLVGDTATRSAELAANFAEQRHRVLAENVANVDTPDFHSRRLDAGAFQSQLAQAVDQACAAGDAELELRGAQVSTRRDGSLAVNPVEEPAANVLFHDGTNARLEGLLADVNENSLYYEMSMNLLRERFRGLLTAIRGRVT